MSHNNNIIPPRGFEGGQPMIQDAMMRPNLGMQLPQFGFGNQGGIQGALQPLRGYISRQLQQKTNEEIGPFIEEVAGNAQETFDIEAGGGYNGGLIPFGGGGYNMSLRRGNGGDNSFLQAGGLESLFQGGQQNMNRAMPMAQGGSVPRQTMIEEQPHMLAYINPEEEMMLRSMGGTGQPGPGGVPAYPPQSVNERDQMDRREAVKNNFLDQTNQENDNDDAERRARIDEYEKNAQKNAERERQVKGMDLLNKTRKRFFENNPKESGIKNEGILTRAVKGSIPYQMFNSLFNNKEVMMNKLEQQKNYPIRGVGGLMDSFFKTTPVRYEPIFNKNNELIGTVGFSAKGTPTNLQGKNVGFNASGQPVDFSNVNASTSDDGPDDTSVSPTAPVTCPDGYIFDSETNACVAIEGTAAATVVEEEPIVVDPNVSVETEYPLFNQGGVASLNDVARNMSRGPRGIAGYQGFMR